MEQGLAASCADPFELATEYLDLMRRARDGKPPITVGDLERRGELRVFLETLIARGEAGDDAQARRRYLRVPTLHDVAFSDGDRSTCGWLTEIAEGGVFVATDTPFSIGASVRIEIVVDDETRQLAHGKVRWSRAHQRDGLPAGMGLSFEALDDEQYGCVVDLMEKALFVSLSHED